MREILFQPAQSSEREIMPDTDISREKQELLELQKTGHYVFHGSSVNVGELHPRQAVDSIRGHDGPPAVFASTEPEQAIFMAIVAPHGRSSSGSTVHNDKPPVLHFGATKVTLKNVTDDTVGYVYVLEKKGLLSHDGSRVEFKSIEPIRPIKKIRVSKRDLPRNITVIPESR